MQETVYRFLQRRIDMPKQDYYRKLFFWGAIWNFMATVPFVLGYRMLFPLLGMASPRYPVFLLMFLGLCFVFGLGYYWVSLDIEQNHGIVMMGILGKTLVFVGLFWASVTGQVHVILLGPGLVDLIFALLYVEFLRTVKRYGA